MSDDTDHQLQIAGLLHTATFKVLTVEEKETVAGKNFLVLQNVGIMYSNPGLYLTTPPPDICNIMKKQKLSAEEALRLKHDANLSWYVFRHHLRKRITIECEGKMRELEDTLRVSI